MFEDGLHNRVDIYKISRDMSNRTTKANPRLSDEPDMANVPCRIIKDEKALFLGALKLWAGCTLKDLDSGTVYEIRGGNHVYGVRAIHHSSYQIRIKSESARHG